MVNAQQTSTAVAASGGMVLYEHNEDSQEQVVSVMCIYTFANVHLMPGVCRNVSFRVSASKASK